MSVSGANRILWSNTAGNVPSSLAEGQLAVNIPDRKLFFRNPAGAVESMRLEEAFYRNASNLNAGAIPDARLAGSYTGLVNVTGSGVASFAGGIIGGASNGGGANYPVWEGNVDFGGDPANTWRQIVGVSSPTGLYTTIGFRVDIVDPGTNHAYSLAVNPVAETYYVACARTEGVTQDSPDMCYVTGPSNRVRAIKTAAGVYQIHIQNLGAAREYRVRISVYTANGAHTVSYFPGAFVASAGVAQYNATVGTGRDDFQNVRVMGGVTNSTGQPYWHQGNDGAASGLDADLLDGQHGSFYQNAGNLNAGTVLDARLPARLGTVARMITDWNLATENGWYMGFNILNQPVAGNIWWLGFVEAHNTIWATQTVHRFAEDGSTDTHVWRRACNNGTWTAWYRLRWSEAELDARYITTSSPNLTGTPTVSGSAIWHDGVVPGAPAYIKDAAIRPREAWDNATFRAAVKAGTDASNGLEEVLNQRGIIRLPDQGEAIKISRRIDMPQHGTRLKGTRLGTRIYFTAANCGIDVKGGYHCEIDGMTFHAGWKAGAVNGGVVPTGGAAIGTGLTAQNTGCHDLQLRNITFDGVYNAVDAYVVNKIICEDMYIRDIYGTAGIKIYGTADNRRSDLFHINRVGIDNPVPYTYTAVNWMGTVDPNGSGGMQPNLFLKSVVLHNGRLYQLTEESPVTPNPYPLITDFPDGNATTGPYVRDIFNRVWFRMARSSTVGVLQDSYAYTLEADSLVVLNLPYGFRMLDSVGAANKVSQPIWAYLDNSDFEHNVYNGVLLSAGSGFKSTLGYIGVTKAGPGLNVTSGYLGEGSWTEGEIRLNAQQGALINSQFAIYGTLFASNGQSGVSGQYDQVLVGSGVDNVQIVGNRFCPAVQVENEFGPMNARRPIAVQSGISNNLMITNNLAWGHATSNAVLNSSTGTGQIIANNS